MTSKELKEAWILWIKSIQNQSYRDVYIALTEKKKHNLVNQLGLTLDEDRIIRCVIRLGAAQLTEGARAPILLPKKNHVTDLLIDSCHWKITALWRVTDPFHGSPNILDSTRTCGSQKSSAEMHNMQET